MNHIVHLGDCLGPVKVMFAARVSPEPNTGCWLWTGKIVSAADPYGRVHVGGQWRRAHRVAWEMVHGDAGDLHILHRCDQPACVNPDHLFAGTNADNVRDRVAKHRSATGQGRVPRIPADVVREIRRRAASGERVVLLAKEFGISRGHAHGIVSGTERSDVR